MKQNLISQHNIVCIGEILWDFLPSGKKLGGAPTNVAWHAEQLGNRAQIISAIGKDSLGDEIMQILSAMKLDARGIAQVFFPTGQVKAVVKDNGDAEYTIKTEVAWDYIPLLSIHKTLVRQADAVVYGSLAQRCQQSQQTIISLLEQTTAKLRVFDVNLRPPFVSKEVLDAGFRHATMVKTNDAEIYQIAELFNWEKWTESVLNALLLYYPNIHDIVVTCGKDGAVWHNHWETVKVAGKKVAVVDTVGAGDAFTAAVVTGMLKNEEKDKILEQATNIAAYVCTQSGATPELPEEYSV